MTVSAALFRTYRPIVAWFSGILVVILAVSIVWTGLIAHPGYTLWLFGANTTAKYWVLVIGMMPISLHLRQFVSNGVTRREFLTGTATLALVLAVLLAVAVPAGHAIESGVLTLLDARHEDYPQLTFGIALGEFGRTLPQSLAYLVTGALAAAIFYRFRPWTGVVLLAPAALPLVVSHLLLGYDERGVPADSWPYAGALAVSLLVTLIGAAGIHWMMRDVTIRPTGG
ncbi:hypothetical protein ACWKSP_18535 [Micromonosporaceae bacterium Da 78-11]